MRCEEIREMLPAFVGKDEDSLALRRHLARCPDCRREMDRYRELTGALDALTETRSEPPADLLSALVAIPQQDRVTTVRRHFTKNRKAYVGGVAVALVGAAGAAAWRTRSRRPVPA